MPTYDAEDIVELKKREKRKKRRLKFLAFLAVALVVFGIFYTKDLWLPKLKNLGRQYKTITNDATLAQGNFPIQISGGSEYQLGYGDDTLFLLCDTYLYYYDLNGGQIEKRQHPYMNPVLRNADKYVLVFESGGDEFTVEDSDEVMYSKQLENAIMFARVSDDGYCAVVTTSDNYACELTVYDDSGKLIYSRSCVDRICDISFDNSSSGCVISYLGADNGELSTSVQSISFDSDMENWTSPQIDTLCIESGGYENGAVVIGISAYAYVDDSGQIVSFYEYEGDFAGGASENGDAAVIINDDDRRSYSLELFGGGAEPVSVEFDEPLKYVEIYDGLAYVMTASSLFSYDFDGGMRSTAKIPDSYEQFRRSDDNIFLMSYDHIDRIDYNS